MDASGVACSASQPDLISELIKWGVLVMLLLFSRNQIAEDTRFPVKRRQCWTLLDIFYVVSVLVCAALAILKAYGTLRKPASHFVETSVLWAASADAALAATLLMMAFIITCRLLRSSRFSALDNALVGLLTTATLTDATLLARRLYDKENVVYEHAPSEPLVLIANVCLAVFMVGNFLFSGIRDTVFRKPSKKRKRAKPQDEDDASVFARIFVTTLYPLIKTTIFPPEKMVDAIPILRRKLHCKPLGLRLQSFLDKSRTKAVSRRHFLATVLRLLWLDVFRCGVCVIAYFVFLFVRVPVMEWLIESSNSWELGISSLFFVVTVVGEFFFSCYQMELVCGLGCRVRATFQAAIFNKMMRLSPTAKVANPSGYVVSILGVDCFQLAVATYMFPVPLAGTLLLPLLLYILALRAGVLPTLCCAAYLLAIGLASLPTSRLQNYLWFLQFRARDERLKRFSDLLSSVRLMKLYAWEEAYEDKVNRARSVELIPLFWINVLDGLIDSVCSASSSVLTIILFATMAIFEPNRSLTAATSFSCIYIIYTTDIVTSQAASVLRSRSQVSLALRRIVKFCTEEEQETGNDSTGGDKCRQKGEVVLEQCSFAWSKASDESSGTVLKNVSLNVKPGSLVGVVGFVGSGKSSLLAGILGDMHRLQGSVTCTGRVAYVPQIANVHNMSVRDNILYGTRMNKANYERVLRACQLRNDLRKFPAGDLTEVGEKGETLSGGQKQRISLARAAYNQADVYLLDDPLSALDPGVAGRVFKELIGKEGILKNKTRIMVCNQGSFLSYMDQLVLVHNKRIIVYDSAAKLLKDPRSPETLRNSSVTTTQRPATDHSADDSKSQGESDGRLMGQEQSKSTMTFWGLTWALLRLSGRCVPVAVLAFAACAVALGYQLIWIKGWIDSSVGATVHRASDGTDWMTGLLVLCLVDVVARCFGGVLLAHSGAHLSRTIHAEMLRCVVSSPVSFFDTTPRGRIMNRLSADLDSIDSKLYLLSKQSLQNGLIMFARLAVIGVQSPTVLLVGAVAGVVLLYGFRITVRASHTSRFFESVATSRVLSHVTESMDAMSSIRAYGVVERFCDHFARLADVNMRGYLTYCMCFRFLRAIAAVCGLAVVLCTLLLCVVGVGTLDRSSVGLSLSAASTIPMSLMYICVTSFSALQMVVAFERCIEYMELPAEVDEAEHKNDPSNDIVKPDGQDWPSQGKVEFDSFAASYRPQILPDVLRCVSFTVEPMQKVGVVGRTGAGKSSLALALLRVLRSSHGSIRIDGLDIAEVPLRKLRRGVTLIPQDPNLVRGSLRENLDPTNSHSDEEIWEALDQAHLKALVSQDPKRLLLEAGEGGSNLSTGQRQLVCLARAILRRPRLLLLDEATSQMDGDTDRLIQATLREGFAHCTLITIAHRIHTVLDYDRILVMDDGRVCEFGSVAELLSNKDSVFHRMADEAGVLQSDETDSTTSL